MDPVVHLRAAVSLLGRFPALAGVDLDVAPSEIVLVRGPNGAGKTTLLRLCAGLAHLTLGRGGRARVRPRERPLAQCEPESGSSATRPGSTTTSTVVDNVRFWARAAGARAADADEAIEQLGLGGRLAKVPVARLSAGQRRRASLAVLVARRPELWLLDEPHAGLDATGRDLVDGLVRRAAAAGATVLIASTSSTGRCRSPVGPSPSSAAACSRRPLLRSPRRGRSVFRDAVLVAGKDLRIEARSRVATNQVGPFALLVLVLFAFALDPDRGILTRATAGLFWVAVLFCALLAVQRAFAIESADGNRDALRLSALDPAGIFLGKAAAVALELLVLEVLLLVGVVVLYDASLDSAGLLVAHLRWPRPPVWPPPVPCTASSPPGCRVRETLLPLLLLPVVAPVLIGATRAFEAALSGTPSEGWPWVGLLGVFALVYTAFGLVAFGPLLEES